MNKFQNGLTVALIVFAVFSRWQIGQAEALAEANRVRGDSIAAEFVVASFANDSTWEVRFATHTDDLAQRFEDSGDTARVRLATELGDANVRIGLLAEVLASAQGEVISVGDRVGARADSLSAAMETCDGSWEGKIDDGLLTALWGFALPSIEHTLTYSVVIPGELVVATAGDGRTLVSAKSNHPRATLALDSVFVDPPDPIVEVKLSKRDGLIAIILGAIGWEIAR